MSEAPSGSNGKRKGRRGKRGTYATSANDSILAFVKAGGAKGRTSSEINAHYKGEGRADSEADRAVKSVENQIVVCCELEA